MELISQVLFYRLCCDSAPSPRSDCSDDWGLNFWRLQAFSPILHLPPQFASWVNAAFLSFSSNIPLKSPLAKWNRNADEQMANVCIHVVYEHFKPLPFHLYLKDKKLKPIHNHSNSWSLPFIPSQLREQDSLYFITLMKMFLLLAWQK